MSRIPDFVHLHVHSHYSLLDGAVTIPGLVTAAKECGMHSLALTDHGNLFGAVQFHRACKAEGIRPIVGMEAYVAPGSRLEKKRTSQGAFFHFTLLARNEEGWRNLMRLSSTAYLDGFYYKPRIDKDLLRQHSGGLIGMSACLSSEINRAALGGSTDDLRAQIESYRDLFDPGCFFLEIQRNGLPEQERVIERVPPIAKDLDLPLVATNDIHYLQRDDARAQEVHLCINTGQTMDDSDRMRFSSDQFYFRNKEEMYRVLGSEFPEAMENTVRVAEMCELDFDFSKTHLPPFEIQDREESAEAFFRRLCEEGCRAKYPDFDSNQTARDRLEYEIGIIKKMGYTNYFLIVWDLIRYARQHGIPVGPGRGSAAGSIVAYSLGITNVDPLTYDLLFERFLNADRISMPDIDIDFCMEGRERVIEYVREKYGNDRVSQIITFGTMAARAVIRDVGRVLNIPLPEVDAIAKRIPAGPGVKLAESLEGDEELVRMRREDQKVAELFDLALRLEGLNRHCSTHAAGVVIGDAPLLDMVPLYRNGEDITSQWTMEDLETAGMLKMDFLGLRTLTICDKCVQEVRRARGVEIDLDELPLDDPNAYELLCRGDTKAVFQLESNGMRDLLRRLRPDRFEDIIALLALYRPGPLEGGMVDRYVARKHGQEPIEYDHPVLEPILEETNGVILYQEQVMRIAHNMAGFTLNEADSLRKAMGKKKKEIMQEFKAKFVSGAQEQGHDPKTASHIFDLIEFFAGYGFNKSHSTAYALVSYQTAYLKANYPTEFMAAVMTCEMSHPDKLVEYREECQKLGLELRPPSIQRSRQGFSVDGEDIWYGLAAIKGMGDRVTDEIVADRERNGPYRSIYDLCERVELNRSALETLVYSGALDDFGQRRSQLCAVNDAALKRGAETRRDAERGQTSFFDLFGDPGTDSGPTDGGNGTGGQGPDEEYPDIPEWTDTERLRAEKQVLGFYLSGHPLEPWRPILAKLAPHRLEQVGELRDGTRMVVGVQVAKITKKVSKRTGDPFWIAAVEDLTGSQEIFVNRELYEQAGETLQTDAIVVIDGKVRYRDTTPSLRVDRLLPIESAAEVLTRELSLTVPLDSPGEAEDCLFRLKEVFRDHQGDCPVYLVLRRPGGQRAVLEVGSRYRVRPGNEFLRAAAAVCGPENLHLNRMTTRN